MKGSLTMNHTSFLIIGAGPYSIAAAAYAKYLGVDVIIVGKPLDFWKTNMPRGMFLRSGSDWQLDAREVATFEAYLRQRGVTTGQIKPVPLETFLDYASWFMGQYAVKSYPSLVTHLASNNGGFVATLADGVHILPNHALLGFGVGVFKNYPRAVLGKLPPGSYTHTRDRAVFVFSSVNGLVR